MAKALFFIQKLNCLYWKSIYDQAFQNVYAHYHCHHGTGPGKNFILETDAFLSYRIYAVHMHEDGLLTTQNTWLNPSRFTPVQYTELSVEASSSCSYSEEFSLNLFLVHIQWCRYVWMNADAWMSELSKHLLMVLPRNRSCWQTWLVVGTSSVCPVHSGWWYPDATCVYTDCPPVSLIFCKPFHHVGSTLHKSKRMAWQLGFDLEQPNQTISNGSTTHVVTTDRSLSYSDSNMVVCNSQEA